MASACRACWNDFVGLLSIVRSTYVPDASGNYSHPVCSDSLAAEGSKDNFSLAEAEFRMLQSLNSDTFASGNPHERVLVHIAEKPGSTVFFASQEGLQYAPIG